MKKLKDTWKELTKLEKTMVSVRDFSCFLILVCAFLQLTGLVPYGAPVIWLLPLAAVAQGVLSWKRSRAVALFFFLFPGFFLFVFFLSQG